MDANNLIGVVNLGVLESEGIPFEEGMRAFRRVVRAFFIKHQDRILFGSDIVLGTFADEDDGGAR